MSCSSKRNRLVGSCISTFVSRTNSFVVGDGPVRAGLREGSKCSVEGAGRSLRSTMGLLGRFNGSAATGGRFVCTVGEFQRGVQAVATKGANGRTFCGANGTGDDPYSIDVAYRETPQPRSPRSTVRRLRAVTAS